MFRVYLRKTVLLRDFDNKSDAERYIETLDVVTKKYTTIEEVANITRMRRCEQKSCKLFARVVEDVAKSRFFISTEWPELKQTYKNIIEQINALNEAGFAAFVLTIIDRDFKTKNDVVNYLRENLMFLTRSKD